MTELLISTKKGLFMMDGEPGAAFNHTARAFPGEPVELAIRDRRNDRLLAATTSPFYGPKIFHSDGDPADWRQADGVQLPQGGDEALVRIWAIAPGQADGLIYAGGDPGVLFVSGDGGASFELHRGLYEHPTRPDWQPGGAGLCLHSICPWPDDPQRLALGISAAGVWLTEDGGGSWRQGNRGILARYLPEEAREGATALCVHHMERAPLRPERLFMQFHGGVYRSDDAGESWIDIGAGLPSDFGFPLALDPADPDSAFVIPLSADMDRITPEGRVRIYETRDAGESWDARSAGLPSSDAYLTVPRQAFTATGEGDSLQLYFGSTNGEVFGSADAGRSWHTVASRLPPVYAVTATG